MDSSDDANNSNYYQLDSVITIVVKEIAVTPDATKTNNKSCINSVAIFTYRWWEYILEVNAFTVFQASMLPLSHRISY